MLRLFSLAVFCSIVGFTTARCLPGDASFEDFCFSFNRLQGSFNDSQAHCIKSVGGSLVPIYNMIENNWIQKFAVDYLDADYDLFWIGASDAGHIQDWRWTDNVPLNFTNWKQGEPLEDRHCGTMSVASGKWFSELCTSKHQFVCQYPASDYPTGASYTCPPCPSCSK